MKRIYKILFALVLCINATLCFAAVELSSSYVGGRSQTISGDVVVSNATTISADNTKIKIVGNLTLNADLTLAGVGITIEVTGNVITNASRNKTANFKVTGNYAVIKVGGNLETNAASGFGYSKSANLEISGSNATINIGGNLTTNSSGSATAKLTLTGANSEMVVAGDLTTDSETKISGNNTVVAVNNNMRNNAALTVSGGATLLIEKSVNQHGNITADAGTIIASPNYDKNKSPNNTYKWDSNASTIYVKNGGFIGIMGDYEGLFGSDALRVDGGSSETVFAEDAIVIGGSASTDKNSNAYQKASNTIANNSSFLPIELTSFSATTNGNNVEFEWETATETNNDYFTIEYSTDVENWHNAKTIVGAGTTQLATEYSTSVSSSSLPQGTVYFRLSQTDYDGTTTSFDVVAVEVENADSEQIDVVVYPNPTTSVVNIKGAEALSVSVINSNGSVENLRQMSDNQYSVSHLRKGIYTLVVETSAGAVSKQLIKQ